MGSDKKTNQNTTPASHGDELDVLEALYSIENKLNKNLLSNNQRKTLETSGRIKKPIIKTKKNINKIADMVVVGLKQRALLGARKEVGDELWKSLSKVDKKRLVFNYFSIYFGITPSGLRSSLQNAYLENN